jgi:predicted secreted hydrolase
LFLSALFLLYGYVQADSEDAYLSVTGPCNFAFPRDHGDHSGYRTEWWYYTGNLYGKDQRPYGFQLTFFRSQISPQADRKSWPLPSSAWRTQQIYLGHAAVSDISGKKHFQAEEVARGALGMAGVKQEEKTTTIYLKKWSAVIEGPLHVIQAQSDEFAFQLKLSSEKAPVFHGLDGYSRKGSTPERASCYYSFTRLHSEGTLTVEGKTFSVAGLGWMDHEFSTAPLEPGIVGWDWFSLQLSDETEIMIFLLREPGNELHQASSGTFVAADGRSRHLSFDDFSIRVLDTWQSKKSKAVYPSRWEMTIPSLSLSLKISPRLADQEMQTTASTGVTYWEGSVSLQGKRKERSLKGSGYVELTGYAQPFDADL